MISIPEPGQRTLSGSGRSWRDTAPDTRSARQPTTRADGRAETVRRVAEPAPSLARPLPSVEDAAADIRRLRQAIEARRQAAPDNVVELAALTVDLQRASAIWQRLAPAGFWA